MYHTNSNKPSTNSSLKFVLGFYEDDEDERNDYEGPCGLEVEIE
jgi:hypothetical protein